MTPSMTAPEFRLGLAILPAHLALRVARLQRYALLPLPCPGCREVGSVTRLVFTAARTSEPAAETLLSLAERTLTTPAAHDHPLLRISHVPATPADHRPEPTAPGDSARATPPAPSSAAARTRTLPERVRPLPLAELKRTALTERSGAAPVEGGGIRDRHHASDVSGAVGATYGSGLEDTATGTVNGDERIDRRGPDRAEDRGTAGEPRRGTATPGEVRSDQHSDGGSATAEVPAAPGRRAAAGVPAAQDLLAKPGIPATPDLPAKPGAPATPDLPAKPGAPATPDLPAKPGAAGGTSHARRRVRVRRAGGARGDALGGQLSRWSGTRPLVAATDASWKNGRGGMGFLTTDGFWGVGSWAVGPQDRTGPSKILVTELRAVQLLLTSVDPAVPMTILVDSIPALRYLWRWQQGETLALPAGYQDDPAGLLPLARQLSQRPHLTFQHVKGHSGHLLNEAADSLASIGRRRASLKYDAETRAADLVNSFLTSWTDQRSA
ncbi:ribonuclease HI [Actinocorallia longicatena]|uniref:RNase H type-1 domain-containing protein n=1 Tax=Actinocorallia longicatena TaxID=111803 RepID=A0ABP6QGC6_9ACTN